MQGSKINRKIEIDRHRENKVQKRRDTEKSLYFSNISGSQHFIFTLGNLPKVNV
jgi:hypothetical protein